MSLIDKVDELKVVVGENELKRIIEFAKKHELRSDSTFGYDNETKKINRRLFFVELWQIESDDVMEEFDNLLNNELGVEYAYGRDSYWFLTKKI